MGTRVIGGWLLVTGTRSTFNFKWAGATLTHTLETWYYRFSDRTMTPVALEERFEDANEVVTRQVSDVTTIQMDASLFSVPSASPAGSGLVTK